MVNCGSKHPWSLSDFVDVVSDFVWCLTSYSQENAE
jgi:hypothetical protein